MVIFGFKIVQSKLKNLLWLASEEALTSGWRGTPLTLRPTARR